MDLGSSIGEPGLASIDPGWGAWEWGMSTKFSSSILVDPRLVPVLMLESQGFELETPVPVLGFLAIHAQVTSFRIMTENIFQFILRSQTKTQKYCPHK